MSMGMSRDEYWNGDIFAAFDYYEAELLRRKNANELAWLQGLYFYDALASVSARLLSKNSNADYTNKPFDIFLDDEEKQAAKKEHENAETLQAKVYMQQLMDVGKNWGKNKN